MQESRGGCGGGGGGSGAAVGGREERRREAAQLGGGLASFVSARMWMQTEHVPKLVVNQIRDVFLYETMCLGISIVLPKVCGGDSPAQSSL